MLLQVGRQGIDTHAVDTRRTFVALHLRQRFLQVLTLDHCFHRRSCDRRAFEVGSRRARFGLSGGGASAFTPRPPDLPPRPLMTVDFAISCSLVRPGRPRYPVFVHRAAALLHAFFRPHLAMTPLRFANPSPPSGWIEDFHLQAVVHTRHTEKAPRKRGHKDNREYATGPDS